MPVPMSGSILDVGTRTNPGHALQMHWASETQAPQRHATDIHTPILLGGSWDLVTKVITRVTILTNTYKPPFGVLITLVTKSHDPPILAASDSAPCLPAIKGKDVRTCHSATASIGALIIREGFWGPVYYRVII